MEVYKIFVGGMNESTNCKVARTFGGSVAQLLLEINHRPSVGTFRYSFVFF